MKVFKTIATIVVALAAIAGIVYVVATYGNKIAAWARKLLNSCKCCYGCDCDCEDCECDCDCDCEAAEEGAIVAEQADFEG